MNPILQPEDMTSLHSDWPLFEIPVDRIVDYLFRKTGQPVCTLSLHESLPNASPSCPDWQLVMREGIYQRLHLNLGIPGIEDPPHPVEENAVALYAAMLLGWHSLPVILSGELDLAVKEGLIPEESLSRLRESFKALS